MRTAAQCLNNVDHSCPLSGPSSHRHAGTKRPIDPSKGEIHRGHHFVEIPDHCLLATQTNEAMGMTSRRYGPKFAALALVSMLGLIQSVSACELNESDQSPLEIRKPVRGERVRLTAGYGMRVHLILGYEKMHIGVDWAAPARCAGNCSGSRSCPISRRGGSLREKGPH